MFAWIAIAFGKLVKEIVLVLLIQSSIFENSVNIDDSTKCDTLALRHGMLFKRLMSVFMKYGNKYKFESLNFESILQ